MMTTMTTLMKMTTTIARFCDKDGDDNGAANDDDDDDDHFEEKKDGMSEMKFLARRDSNGFKRRRPIE